MRQAIAAALLQLIAASASPAQDRAFVRDAGPGEPGRILREALTGPHLVLRPDTSPLILPRGSTHRATIVVLGADVKLAAVVHGHVIVIGGDLFVRPGAHVTGRGVAFGGGVYSSTLAVIEGDLRAYRDVIFDALPAPGGIALDYRALRVERARAIAFPGIYGLRFPSYDRVDGAELRWGPSFAVGEGRLEIDPTVTYRSHLGAIDPALTLRAHFGRLTLIEAVAGRGTFTNDEWIRSDLLNALSSLALGSDLRNYYRADRAEVRVHRRWEGRTWTAVPFGGALAERAWSVGPQASTATAPWSALRRRDREEGMLRPNPPVLAGQITSLVAGVAVRGAPGGIEAGVDGRSELALRSPAGRGFVQTSVHATVAFPTFGSQRFELLTHAVHSSRSPPPQRYTYLGGSGTLPTFRLLEFGGDQLFFAEGEYIVPIERVVIRYLGTPAVSLRYMLGAAGVGELPPLEQNVGVRLRVGVLRMDYTIEPVDGASDLSFGLSLFR